MGIKEDFRDVKEALGTLPLVGKLFVGGTFVVSLMSIFSLADTFYQMKGFLAEAIQFYRMLTAPIARYVIDHVPRILERRDFDLAVLVIFITSASLRGVFASTGEDWRRLPLKWRALVVIVSLVFFGALIAWTALLAKNSFGYPVAMAVVGLGIPGLALFIGYYSDEIENRAAGYSVFAVYMLVAIIAAISEGLMRSL